jgi:hypothetical protein
VDGSNLKTADALQLIGDMLSPGVWTRVPHGTKFSRLIAPEVEARLDFSLVQRPRPSRIHVTPYVEIFHYGIENARKYITGRTLYTINEQLQFLMADKDSFLAWNFYRDGDPVEAARHVAVDCQEYAPEFYEQFRTLDDIVRGLERLAEGKRTIMRQSLAIAYCLQGNKDAALGVLTDEIEAVKANPDDIAHKQLPRYADLFDLRF